MDEQVKEARIHPWVYYIAPINSRLVFSAFCKGCRQYFSEYITLPEYTTSPGAFSISHLPRYGCQPISEDAMV